jgi:demethylmenaquinone methyltransferase/2-methoxy-6-polyprenyl-1,4-benzoquinol methylase
MGAFRKAAVRTLALRPGDTVVELGCGTGLNFRLLQRSIGPSGRIIGVDMTDAMLAKARERIRRYQWCNVELVQSDVAKYAFRSSVDGILSTFAMEFVPEYDDLIRRCSEALRPGRYMVVGDLKPPEGRLAGLAPYLGTLARRYGTTMDLADRPPWESVRNYLDDVRLTEFYFGYAYLASGTRRRAKMSFHDTPQPHSRRRA